jgi:hypothetical protein
MNKLPLIEAKKRKINYLRIYFHQKQKMIKEKIIFQEIIMIY